MIAAGRPDVRISMQRTREPLGAPQNMADRALIERCLSGDAASQRELYFRERRRLRARLSHLLGPTPEVDDLVQDVLFAVFRGLDRFRGEASLAAWIDAVAIRASYLHIRRQLGQRTLCAMFEDATSSAPGPEQVAMAREDVGRLQRILRKISADHSLTFTLHVIEGRPLSEVARSTEVTLAAAKARLVRARRQLERYAKRDALLAHYLTSTSRVDDATASLKRGRKGIGGDLGSTSSARREAPEEAAAAGSRE
jgi:RNA polymerase sigma-70 factor (ECF subfamily)